MTEPDPLRGNGHVIESLGHAISSGEHGLSTVPGLVKRVIKEGSWREFVTKRGELVEHESFTSFVETPPLRGLGASRDLIEKIVKGTDAEVPVRQAFKAKRGPKPLGSKRNNITETITGTRRDYAVERLERDRPDLHAQVLANELSAHAAAIQAGFRRRTFTVRADDPEKIAATLRRQLPGDVLKRVINILEGW